ncbi:GNAT family N-acetyltransferase [bacterium]|nr:MAG: GNAT family N-acetyltransferase [bacterium]
MGRTSYYYQAGFDPEAKAMSPGTLLVATRSCSL